ncbi:unnamed protein product [Adineta ricciae]|uniref:Uncharacterized protein n=1 Tax=Adineta ricciae TaxID=249248 RepID=A0A815ALK0_ADIRI|nr:unnamed protein product [Adineta ricciae]CAF1678046.1 unnamed protein product [Adineta ricciae]
MSRSDLADLVRLATEISQHTERKAALCAAIASRISAGLSYSDLSWYLTQCEESLKCAIDQKKLVLKYMREARKENQ